MVRLGAMFSSRPSHPNANAKDLVRSWRERAWCRERDFSRGALTARARGSRSRQSSPIMELTAGLAARVSLGTRCVRRYPFEGKLLFLQDMNPIKPILAHG